MATGEIKNRHPHHNLPQACGGSKSIYPIWIWPTINFQQHPRKSFRINSFWSIEYDTHKSNITILNIEQKN